MSIVLDGTSGLTSPAAVLTTTPLAVTSGGTGVTTSTGTGAGVHATSPTITGATITGATITVAATAAPAFRAYLSSTQTISAITTTKVAFNAENFDTNSNFDSTTNYRFTPTVAGYYQVTSNVAFTTGAGSLNVYKNGSNYQTGVGVTYNSSLGGHIPISDLVYLNGSTDYIEIYVYLTTGTTITSGDTNTMFSGAMVRSA
jgi:hypothetical protein